MRFIGFIEFKKNAFVTEGYTSNNLFKASRNIYSIQIISKEKSFKRSEEKRIFKEVIQGFFFIINFGFIFIGINKYNSLEL